MVDDNPAWPPQFYLIGAQKAGTTSLAGWLAEHPEIILSNPKEPDFFAWNWKRDWDWYRSCFDIAPDKKLLDASTSYSMIPTARNEPETVSTLLMRGVPERLYQARSDARLIYVLRDPVQRAYSAYWHYRRLGEESMSLLQAVVEGSIYERCSRYSQQFAALNAYFPREQFLFIDFHDLIHNPQAVVEACFAFLGLPPYRVELLKAKNQSYNPNVLGRMLLNRKTLGFAQRLQKQIPKAGAKFIKSVLTSDIPPPTADEQVALQELFAAEYACSVELFGIDFKRN